LKLCARLIEIELSRPTDKVLLNRLIAKNLMNFGPILFWHWIATISEIGLPHYQTIRIWTFRSPVPSTA